jgi:hypothetical protein
MNYINQAAPGSRGIYLVANQISSDLCHNLIYTIRQCGCRLPIRVIPFGGEPIRVDPSLEDVKLLRLDDFPAEGLAFVSELKRRIPCRPGWLHRYLAWFGEFAEFIYSDNDVIALTNWENLFPYLAACELVHADHQFRDGARFNWVQPDRIEALLGPDALDRAINSGHFVCRPSPYQLTDLMTALHWMEAHRELHKWQDQVLLNAAVALGKWQVLNLCKPPHNWSNSSANHYQNLFDVFRSVQVDRKPISHIHYAGYNPVGTRPVDELIFTNLPITERNRKLLWALAREKSGVTEAQRLLRRARQKAEYRLRRA